MTRAQLEHVLRAAAGITGADVFYIIGSQAILGEFPDAPPECRASMEADIFTRRSADDSDLIDGSIGEGSPFHQTFGYHAHGVGPETAVLPDGWESRVVAIRSPGTKGATGFCPEVHDLAISKLVAGRDKDVAFVSALLRAGLVRDDELTTRLARTSLEPRLRAECGARLSRVLTRATDP